MLFALLLTLALILIISEGGKSAMKHVPVGDGFCPDQLLTREEAFELFEAQMARNNQTEPSLPAPPRPKVVATLVPPPPKERKNKVAVQKGLPIPKKVSQTHSRVNQRIPMPPGHTSQSKPAKVVPLRSKPQPQSMPRVISSPMRKLGYATMPSTATRTNG